ncbi:UTRA domain-containing protein [Streptomyces sp. HNM0575]|nr:UTRA domain-containing protein [Streptomyces sp. HNM0575]
MDLQPEPRRATAEGIALLSLPRGALVTQIQRAYYAEDGRPVETADTVVPTALCELVYEVSVATG